MRYAFITAWHTSVPVEAVWQAITQVEDWPAWWRGVKEVKKVRDGDDRGVGAHYVFVWRSRLPYDLSFTMETTQVVEHRLIVGHATGELDDSSDEDSERPKCNWRESGVSH